MLGSRFRAPRKVQVLGLGSVVWGGGPGAGCVGAGVWWPVTWGDRVSPWGGLVKHLAVVWCDGSRGRGLRCHLGLRCWLRGGRDVLSRAVAVLLDRVVSYRGKLGCLRCEPDVGPLKRKLSCFRCCWGRSESVGRCRRSFEMLCMIWRVEWTRSRFRLVVPLRGGRGWEAVAPARGFALLLC